MNRMGIVGAIMGVAVVAGGGGAYYYTATHPGAPTSTSLAAAAAGPPPPSAKPSTAGATADGAMAQVASLSAGEAEASRPALPDGPVPITDAVANFDPASHHFFWVLPPGVKAKGPFRVDITVKHDGKKELTRSVTLTADYPQPGSRAEFPRSAQTVRISADSGWAAAVGELKASVAGLQAKHGPAGAELTYDSDLKTEIDADAKADYCGDDGMPKSPVYIDNGTKLADNVVLLPVDVAAAQLIFKKALESGCKK